MPNPKKEFNYWVIIPVFNEERYLSRVLSGVKKEAKNILVVNDGSTDRTEEILRKSGVPFVSHRINLGKGAALKTGCETAFFSGAQAIVMIDGDGQHNPKEIKKLIKPLAENKAEIVFGSRVFGFGVPLVRFLSNKFACLLIRFLFGIYVSDLTSGFRAFSFSGYQKINWNSDRYSVETEMVARAGKNKVAFLEVPIQMIYNDSYKGVSFLDALKTLFSVLEWRLTWDF